MQNRNIRLFYWLEFILSFSGGIILPVYVCYFRLYDITLFQVALLAVVFEASIIVFEFPTGKFADKFGRKLSTSIGFLFFAVSAVIFFSFRSFYGFLVAEIVFGLAETFISGALEALTVDSLKVENGHRQLAKLFANRTVFRTSALLAGMIIGGFLAQYYLNNLFLPVALIALTGFVLSLFLYEPKIDSVDSLNNKSADTKPNLATLVFSNKKILALFAVGLLANFAYEPVDQFWQVLFSEIKQIPLFSFGLITGSGLAIVAVTAKFTEKLYDRLILYLFSCFILMSLSLYIVNASGLYPAIAGIVVYFVIKELISPVISTHLNKQFNSANRAIYLSSFNLTCSIGEVSAGLIAGFLAETYGVKFIFYFAAISALLVPLIYFVIARMSGSERCKT